MIRKRRHLEVELLENRLTPSAAPPSTLWLVDVVANDTGTVTNPLAPTGIILLPKQGLEDVDFALPVGMYSCTAVVYSLVEKAAPAPGADPAAPPPASAGATAPAPVPAGWYALTAEVPVYLGSASVAAGGTESATSVQGAGPLVTVCKITKTIEFIEPCDGFDLSTLNSNSDVALVCLEGTDAGTGAASAIGNMLTPNGGAEDVDFALPVGIYVCTVAVYSAPAHSGQTIAPAPATDPNASLPTPTSGWYALTAEVPVSLPVTSTSGAAATAPTDQFSYPPPE